VSELAAWLFGLGQQVWQEQREETGSVCFVSIAPFLLGAAIVGVRSFSRGLRRRSAPEAGGQA
jgi:hypothetical protein